MNYIKITRKETKLNYYLANSIHLEGKYDLELWKISDNERENDRFIISKRDLSGIEILKYTELLLELQD